MTGSPLRAMVIKVGTLEGVFPHHQTLPAWNVFRSLRQCVRMRTTADGSARDTGDDRGVGFEPSEVELTGLKDSLV